MKNARMITAAIALLVSSASFAQMIQVTVNDELVSFKDVQPMMIDGRVMVPLRGVFEHFDADVNWNGMTGTVSVMTVPRTISLRVGEGWATINGEQKGMEQAAIMHHNRVMVPLRFLSEALGAEVNWVEPSRIVAIKLPSKK